MLSIKFTVVIPLYNKEKYIKRTINSALAQTYPEFEILVINDGSTDNSVQIVKSIKDSRIKIIEQRNQGVSAARNRGVTESKHNYIALLDGDDEWMPEFLESIKSVIYKNDWCIGYATSYYKVKENKKIFYPKLKYVPHEKGVLKNYYKSCFFGNQIVTSSSICLNKKVLEKNKLTKLFPLNVKRGEDLDAWVRLAANNEIYFINKPLVKINSVADNVSNSDYKYEESFDYQKWYKYRTNESNKSKYLKLLIVKKNFLIIKKMILKKKINQIPNLIRNIYRH